MAGQVLAPAPCLTRRKMRQRRWAFLPGWAPHLQPLPSIQTSSETLGDGKSISRQLSLGLCLSFHLHPTIHLGHTGENTSSKTQQIQGGGALTGDEMHSPGSGLSSEGHLDVYRDLVHNHFNISERLWRFNQGANQRQVHIFLLVSYRPGS